MTGCTAHEAGCTGTAVVHLIVGPVKEEDGARYTGISWCRSCALAIVNGKEAVHLDAEIQIVATETRQGLKRRGKK